MAACTATSLDSPTKVQNQVPDRDNVELNIKTYSTGLDLHDLDALDDIQGKSTHRLTHPKCSWVSPGFGPMNALILH